MTQPGRARFPDSPKGSVSWAYYSDDGATLVIEFFDYGDEAASSMGGDVAYLLHLDAESQRLFSEKLGEPARPETLIQRFGNYGDVKRYLNEHAIPYRHEFDSQA
ncbi:MAG: hypothetical protein SFV54_23765 [Bryobacteraceae bacterium]|nr:hypothetical protein [Bryobacteraceae bacterium]